MQTWRVYIRKHPSFGPWYARVERRPGWVAGIAMAAAAVVILVPLLLLTVAAIFVGVVVFVTLGAIVWAVALVRSLIAQVTLGTRGRGDGRQNVRVIRR